MSKALSNISKSIFSTPLFAAIHQSIKAVSIDKASTNPNIFSGFFISNKFLSKIIRGNTVFSVYLFPFFITADLSVANTFVESIVGIAIHSTPSFAA